MKELRLKNSSSKFLISFLSLFLCFFWPTVCMAGKYASDFLSIGAGARALAMGSSSVASASDATSGYWNPAGLVSVSKHSLVMMHAEMFSGLETYNFASVAYTDDKIGTFGVSFIRLGVEDIPIYDALYGTAEERLANFDLQPSDKPEGFLSDVENAFLLSYARKSDTPFYISNIPLTISWGANIKYILQRLSNARKKGLGFDMGLKFSALKHGQLSFAVVIIDVANTRLLWNTNREETIPANLKLGLAYTPQVSQVSEFFDITIAFDLETRYGLSSHLGLETTILNQLSLRTGLDGASLTMGVGFTIKNFSVDYAYCRKEVGNSHQMSLGLAF